MILGHVPDRGLREDGLREDTRAAIESVSDDPIKHLNQEGESLQKSAVIVVRKSRSAWRVECCPAAPPLLREVLARRDNIDTGVCVRAISGYVVGSSCIAWLYVQESIFPFRCVEDAVSAPPGNYHGPNENTRNYLPRISSQWR